MTRAEIIAAEDAAAEAEDRAYAEAQQAAKKPHCRACGSTEDLSYRWGELQCQKCINSSI